jgi:hypothetical protein
MTTIRTGIAGYALLIGPLDQPPPTVEGENLYVEPVTGVTLLGPAASAKTPPLPIASRRTARIAFRQAAHHGCKSTLRMASACRRQHPHAVLQLLTEVR